MTDIREQCCGSDGKPDFGMMKQFMERCGKQEFTEDQISKMKEFCCMEGGPDMSKMKQMMEEFGCHLLESAQEE